MNTVKQFYTTYIKRWVKAFASAVGGAIAGLLINWAQGTTPIPTTQKELYTVLVAAVLPALVSLFAPTNKITQKQLDKDPGVAPGAVVVPESPTNVVKTDTTDIDDVPPPTPGLGGYRNPWRT